MTPNMFVGAAMVILTLALTGISVFSHLKTQGRIGGGWAVIAFISFILTTMHLSEMATYE